MYKLLLCWRYLAVLTAAIAPGCGTVRTEHSLETVAEQVVDEAFVGVWQALPDPVFEGQQCLLEVSFVGNGIFRASFRDSDGSVDDPVTGRCFQVGECVFFEPLSTLESEQGQTERVGLGQPLGPSFISVAREEDLLVLRLPDAEAFAKLIQRSDQLAGNISGLISKSVEITSGPSELAEVLVKHHDILFAAPQKFRLMPGAKVGAASETETSAKDASKASAENSP